MIAAENLVTIALFTLDENDFILDDVFREVEVLMMDCITNYLLLTKKKSIQFSPLVPWSMVPL